MALISVSPDMMLERPFRALREPFRCTPRAISTPPRWTPPWTSVVVRDADDADSPAPDPSDHRAATFDSVVPRSSSSSSRGPTTHGQLDPGALRGTTPSSDPAMFKKVLNGLIPTERCPSKRRATCISKELVGMIGAKKCGRRIAQIVRKEAPLADQAQTGPPTLQDTWTPQRDTIASPPPLPTPRVFESATEAEVVTFRNSLAKTFGNLPRAFQAMKAASGNALGSGVGVRSSRPASDSINLTAAEFEWCVIAFMKIGDRKQARRIFNALDRDKKGEIGVWELAQPSQHSKGLLSLVEFRRILLDRHTNLSRAFRELEDYMQLQNFQRGLAGGQYDERRGGKSRIVRLNEFVKAAAFFGLEGHQASHLFGIIDTDGNGQLTLDEFLEALTNMPREVLLEDFRERLVARHSSIANAFHELIGDAAVRLNRSKFVTILVCIGFCEIEANELFRIVDHDGSGEISIDEFREALREGAPSISLEGFWQRFAAEWPEILAAARGNSAGGRRHVCTLLQDLLPEHIQKQCTRSKIGDDTIASMTVLTPEAFDTIAALLDVSKRNATGLFDRILASTARRSHCLSEASHMPSEGRDDTDSQEDVDVAFDAEASECYMEDFLEQLQLWVNNPLGVRGGGGGRPGMPRAWALQNVMQVSAPAKARISALKAELAPLSCTPEARPRDAAADTARVEPPRVIRQPSDKDQDALAMVPRHSTGSREAEKPRGRRWPGENGLDIPKTSRAMSAGLEVERVRTRFRLSDKDPDTPIVSRALSASPEASLSRRTSAEFEASRRRQVRRLPKMPWRSSTHAPPLPTAHPAFVT